MYVEITGIENPIISKFELERDFYVGAEYTNPIKVKWPSEIENSYITVSYENSRHMKYGPVYADEVSNNEALFNLTNARMLVPGELQISIFINIVNSQKTIKRYAVGVVSAMIKKAVYDSGNIIVLDESDPSEVIMDMKDSLEKTNNLVAAIDAQLKEMVSEDGNFQVRGNMNVGGTLSVKNDLVVCQAELNLLRQNLESSISTLDTKTCNVTTALDIKFSNAVSNLEAKTNKALKNKIRTVKTIPSDAEVGDYFFVEQGGLNMATSLEKNEDIKAVQGTTQSISISPANDEISVLNNDNKQNLNIL